MTAPARLVLAAFLAFIPAARAATPSVYRVVVPDLPQNSRLMGIRLVIRPGRIVRVADCPAGWSVSVLNDPNWTATAEAHAIVGAAAITPRQAGSMVLVSAAPADTLPDDGPIRAAGEITTMHDGDLSHIKLTHIALVPYAAPGSAGEPVAR